VFLFGDAIPFGDGDAVLIFGRDAFLPGEECVGFDNVVEVADDGDRGWASRRVRKCHWR
jgi:hypothetical protein